MPNFLPDVSFTQIVMLTEDLLKFQPVYPNRVVSFMSWSANPYAKTEVLVQSMLSRKTWLEVPADVHINSQEVPTFKLRLDLLANDNVAYELFIRENPEVDQLERLAMIKPCWSTLFPIKLYLLAHPELAQRYFGMQPFGKQVIRTFNILNARTPTTPMVAGQPTYVDHLALRDMTNRMARLSGHTTAWINSWMYLVGQLLTDGPTQPLRQEPDRPVRENP